MKNSLYENLFDLEINNDMKISCVDNEIYNQLILYIFSHDKKNLLLITSNLNEANKLFFNLKNYYDEVYIFPDDDYLTKKAIATSPDLLYMRMNLLNNILNNTKKIIICPINSYFKKLPSLNTFKNLSLSLKVDDNYDRDDILKKLDTIGYKKDVVVTNTGEYSVRGFILDIFPIDQDHPIRVEFFDDQIEKIKVFDENTQLSINDLSSIKILPIIDEYSESNSTIIDYLNSPIIIVQDLKKIIKSVETINEQAKYYEENNNYIFNVDSINNKIFVDLIDNYDKYDYLIKSEEIPNYNENTDKFVTDILKNNGVVYSKSKKLNELLNKKNISVIDEFLNKGFIYNEKYYCSSNDLKKSKNEYNYNIKYKVGKRITSIENLEIGDYVIHKKHGIGVYMGITTIKKNDLENDYILLQYKGTDKLYIPVNSLEKLYKYSSKDGAKPNIQRLNSNEWEKVKNKIKTKIKEISEELIKLYRARNNASVLPYEKDDALQLQFESEFSYEPTIDQIKAINEIKKDLESSKPMDRLLCGDVGYGKTEVIFRAIFKTVMNNKQVLYLCPTTLLSQQQYDNAINRFKNYGVNIEILNRFNTLKDTKRILEDLSSGKIDVLIGTHRLLSDDIKPKNLGLLVIDEEQRFGVMHKEKIKKYKNNVHILSVSATPIPRSLQMSLTGIRDLSLIETPPKNRYPVQTYVIAYDELLLKEAIQKEISRNGQVFILYNNIQKMEEKLKRFQNIMPDVSFKYAHGKMDKDEIQNIMTEFYNNEFNVLLSTTIIENGIDIPNANTMIVIDADHYGLSQLYQIRGRVGRSNKIAYTYLMYDPKSTLNEIAVKRLNAIKEFTNLGSGYKIAMRDLSIRGAGDMLGTEQAGFIDSVGVDLYLDLINEELNGKKEENNESQTLLDNVSTHIDKKYTEEDELIIELHNKINQVNSDDEYYGLKNEIIDRFGFIDEKIENYITQEYVENLLKQINIKILISDNSKISLRIDESIYRKLNIENLFVYATRLNSKFAFVYRNNYIVLSLLKLNYEKHYLYYILEILKYIKNEVNN